MPSRPLTLGLDLGTSAVKVIAIETDGQRAAEGAAAFDTASELPLQAEQSPADWLRAARDAMRAMGDHLQATRGADWRRDVVAIGLTGQLPTLVCLGDAAPIAPAITWRDGRADEWAAERIDAPARARMYARTGMPIDGRYLAPMLRFHFGERLAEITGILSAKDYLLFALTGERLTEPSTAAGYGVFDLQAQRFDESLCRFWDLPLRLLPQIRPANSIAAPLNADGARLLDLPPAVPVYIGAADSACASYAMAGLSEHSIAISFGSSAVVIGASATPAFDRAGRYLLTPHAVPGWFGREMDLLASGTGYRWLGDLLGLPGAELDRAAARAPAGANGLRFAPYLAGGEQGALWNPALRGALVGLTLRHTRNDIARAYLEGVFFEVRRCIEVLRETSRVDEVAVSGNLVDSPATLRMLADILHCPIRAVTEKSPAALGAALLAGAAMSAEGRAPAGPRAAIGPGAASGPDAATSVVPPPVAVTSPEPAAVIAYEALYQDYLTRSAACQ